MKLYHITYKKNLDNIKKLGLLKSLHLSNSHYEDITSGEAVYLSKYPKGNNLPIHMHGKELISLEINLSSLNKDLIYPDDGLYWAFNNEIIFTEDDLEEIREAFNLQDDNEAMKKLEYLDTLTDDDLAKEFKGLWYWYLIKEGEIAYKADIPYSLIDDFFEF